MSAASIVTCAVVVGLVGCSSDPATGTPAPAGTTPGGGTTTPPATTKAAGKIRGTIRDESGKAISVAGVKYHVTASGLATASSQEVSVSPAVKPDGTYEADLVDGLWRAHAKIEVSWNNGTYNFELDPVQDNSADQPSKDGIVQDFVWKIRGPYYLYRQNPDPKNHTNWYGGSVRVSHSLYRNDKMAATTTPADGTKWQFTLTPTDPALIDGSPAKEVKFERSWTGDDLDNGLLNDIPLGIYKLTGTETAPGAGPVPLVFEVEYAKFVSEVKIDFPVDKISAGAPFVKILAFDK
jgi:hypothetical protein